MERQICTKENPYDAKTDTGRWSHPDAKSYGEGNDPNLDGYKCPNCGKIFWQEY